MSSGLLGPDGRPLKSTITNKKAEPPRTGAGFGRWSGQDVTYATLPGGGVVQFDLSKLTLGDFRTMRDHYQVNASLAVLSFMQHQSDWHIESKDKKIAEFCEEHLRSIWTELNASLATANWAGYSPNALEWENDLNKKALVINKVKDLIPEDCSVKWDHEEGWAPPGEVKPKVPVYGGIRQLGQRYPIPVENSLWYPLLMENGDYYGRKLLKPAFQSWFFSILVHLFANRYYERFGEPTPIGRAPFDEDIDISGTQKSGQTFMLETLQALRNRSVVVLPNDSMQDTHGRINYDYQIDYLESQMRGADFERYLTRLDEEISIGLFTPILLLRTADVGSYNLGTAHMQVYLWMLNAMNDDRARYIDRFILRKMVNYNFSEKAPDAKIIFRKMGNQNADLLQAMITGLIAKDELRPDITELGQMAGMTLKEIQRTTADPGTSGDGGDGGDGGKGGTNPGPTPPPGGGRKGSNSAAQAVMHDIIARVRPQVENAFKANTFGPDSNFTMGYRRRLEAALKDEGRYDPVGRTAGLYGYMDTWLVDMASLGKDEFSGPDSFMESFQATLGRQFEEMIGA